MDPKQNLMPQMIPTSMNDFLLHGRMILLTVLKSAEILAPPVVEAGFYFILPDSKTQVLPTHQVFSW